MLIKIDSPAPKFWVNSRNFTREMEQLGACRSWFTIDLPDLDLQDGTITSVRPRIGSGRLVAAPFGTAPIFAEAGQYKAAIHKRDTLDHLTVEAPWIKPENFSLAVIASADPGVKTPQNIASIAGSGRALRIVLADRAFWLRAQSEEVLTTDSICDDEPGPFLIILSASESRVRLRIKNASRTSDIYSEEYVPDLPAPLRLVLGADQVAEKPGRPVPSAPRSWRGATFELLAFSTDILVDVDSAEVKLVDSYFNQVYGSSS